LFFTMMIVFHTLVCILLVIVVLKQSAKGEGLAGAFGGGGGGGGLSGAVFGGRGAASFLSKATSVLAVVFMINCGILAFMSSSKTGRLSGATDDSAVTTEAQREMERQAAQQDAFPMDTSAIPLEGETGGEAGDVGLPAAPATDTGQ